MRYFYHPDHLGSSSVSTPLNNHWITDGSGNAIQHLHYLPFGEDWVDQRNASWSAPYTFSGKEKDVETGYSYFGARYYDSGLSIWLSVDPMSDKYPNLTPYAYCANNPVILVDPDGRTIYHPSGTFPASYGYVYWNIQHNDTYKSLVSTFNKSTNNLRFDTQNSDYSYGNTCADIQGKTDQNGEVLSFTCDVTIYLSSNRKKTEIGLVETFLHEAVHARDIANLTTGSKSHEGFDREAVLDGLIEYNDTFGLGYSFEQLEIISWGGCQNSPEFQNYIEEKAAQNNITYNKQLSNWKKEFYRLSEVSE